MGTRPPPPSPKVIAIKLLSQLFVTMQKYAFQTVEHRLKSVKTLQTSFYIYTYRICSVPNLMYVTRQLFRLIRADQFKSKISITVAIY